MSAIKIDADILGGTPCFAGTRVPVKTLFSLIEHGRTIDYFLEGFPTVSREQVLMVLQEAGMRVIAVNPHDERPDLTPTAFWSAYRERMRLGRWSDYQDNRTWTEFAKLQAEAVCHDFGLLTSREYLRLDVAAWTNASDDKRDWRLQVAFEVESLDWCDELCKLAHVNATLKVLIGYEFHRRRDAIDTLKERFALQGDLLVGRGEQWLIAFGPRGWSRDDRWNAFTLTAEGVSALPDDLPLAGLMMAD